MGIIKTEQEGALMEQQEAYNSQKKLSSLSFLTELPNLIAVTIAAMMSHSILTWLDFVDSLGNIVSDAIVVVQSRKMSKELRYEYNYGVGKLEAMTTFFCQSIEIGGLLVILVISIMQLINLKRPSDLLIYVVVLKVINVLVDIAFEREQRKIKNANPSSVANGEYLATVGVLFFDITTLVSILIVWLLRDNPVSWFVSPLFSIAIAIGLLMYCLRNVRNAVNELTDRTLPEKDQLEVMKVLIKHSDEYSSFESIKSHYNGMYADIDITVAFFPDTTFEEIRSFQSEIQTEMDKDIEHCRVSIIIANN